MNPFVLIRRRPVGTLLVVATIAGVGVVGLSTLRADVESPLSSPKIYEYLDYIGANARQVKAYVVGKFESHSQEHEEQAHHEGSRIIATKPKAMDITLTQPYVCQIHSRRHIEVCALENGYLEQILVREGQSVKKGDLMFKIVPTLYQARLDAEVAEAQLAELEFNNTKRLADQNVVSQNEVKLLQAKLDKARAKVSLAKAELNFTNVIAPFDGIVDRLQEQLGSLIKEGDVLTTLSDNSVMWVYFNVPEAAYLDYMTHRDQHERLELVLANGNKFSQSGKIGAIEAKFNNETGNIPFRADFPNPDGLLRHGQTGTVLISRTEKDAVIIPQRATFELLDKRYVWAVGEDDVVHQRLITVKHELEDIFVVGSGLDVKDKIVLEGVREVHDGENVHHEFQAPEVALKDQKFHAE